MALGLGLGLGLGVRVRVRVKGPRRRVDPLEGGVLGVAAGRVEHRAHAVLAGRVLREVGRQQGLGLPG